MFILFLCLLWLTVGLVPLRDGVFFEHSDFSKNIGITTDLILNVDTITNIPVLDVHTAKHMYIYSGSRFPVFVNTTLDYENAVNTTTSSSFSCVNQNEFALSISCSDTACSTLIVSCAPIIDKIIRSMTLQQSGVVLVPGSSSVTLCPSTHPFAVGVQCETSSDCLSGGIRLLCDSYTIPDSTALLNADDTCGNSCHGIPGGCSNTPVLSMMNYGTHNSIAYDLKGCFNNNEQLCESLLHSQNMTITQQLDIGLRAFDFDFCADVEGSTNSRPCHVFNLDVKGVAEPSANRRTYTPILEEMVAWLKSSSSDCDLVIIRLSNVEDDRTIVMAYEELYLSGLLQISAYRLPDEAETLREYKARMEIELGVSPRVLLIFTSDGSWGRLFAKENEEWWELLEGRQPLSDDAGYIDPAFQSSVKDAQQLGYSVFNHYTNLTTINPPVHFALYYWVKMLRQENEVHASIDDYRPNLVLGVFSQSNPFLMDGIHTFNAIQNSTVAAGYPPIGFKSKKTEIPLTSDYSFPCIFQLVNEAWTYGVVNPLGPCNARMNAQAAFLQYVRVFMEGCGWLSELQLESDDDGVCTLCLNPECRAPKLNILRNVFFVLSEAASGQKMTAFSVNEYHIVISVFIRLWLGLPVVGAMDTATDEEADEYLQLQYDAGVKANETIIEEVQTINSDGEIEYVNVTKIISFEKNWWQEKPSDKVENITALPTTLSLTQNSTAGTLYQLFGPGLSSVLFDWPEALDFAAMRAVNRLNDLRTLNAHDSCILIFSRTNFRGRVDFICEGYYEDVFVTTTRFDNWTDRDWSTTDGMPKSFFIPQGLLVESVGGSSSASPGVRKCLSGPLWETGESDAWFETGVNIGVGRILTGRGCFV